MKHPLGWPPQPQGQYSIMPWENHLFSLFLFGPDYRSSFMWKAIIGWSLLCLIALTGCVSAPPLPKANLSEPGWTVQQGQAVWHRPPSQGKQSGPGELAGDLTLATRTDGSAFVQFSKSLPLVIAQRTPTAWQIESPVQNIRFARHGKPPRRIIWFQLIDALTGKPLAKGWRWTNSDTNWHLENSSSGEYLEGYLSQ